jgi:hypothetical protein
MSTIGVYARLRIRSFAKGDSMIQVPPELFGPSTYAALGHAGKVGPVVLGYLDPGTGSLVIQAALAAGLTVPFVLRSKFRALVAHLRRHGGRLALDKANPR